MKKKKTGKRGPPRKLTPELTETIAKIVRSGNTLKNAADRVGINPTTISTWRAKYKEFDEAIKKAVSEAQAYFLSRIRIAAEEPKTWQAAAWILERRWPEEFAVKHHVPERQPSGYDEIQYLTPDGRIESKPVATTTSGTGSTK